MEEEKEVQPLPDEDAKIKEEIQKELRRISAAKRKNKRG